MKFRDAVLTKKL